MDSYGVAEAKAQLSDILERVAAGERVTVTRRGVPIAVISPVDGDERRPRIDWDLIDRFRQSLPMSRTPAAVLIRRMRDEEPE